MSENTPFYKLKEAYCDRRIAPRATTRFLLVDVHQQSVSALPPRLIGDHDTPRALLRRVTRRRTMMAGGP